MRSLTGSFLLSLLVLTVIFRSACVGISLTENRTTSFSADGNFSRQTPAAKLDIDQEESAKRSDRPDPLFADIDESKMKWVSEIYQEARSLFEMNSSLVSGQCYRDYGIYRANLRSQSVWAVKIMESSDWPVTGIFTGLSTHFGNYDECITAISIDSSISGKYCLAESTFNIKGNPNWKSDVEITTDIPDPDKSVWEAITMYRKDPVRADRTKVKWAICLPSSCTADDLEVTLDNIMKPIFSKYQLDLNVNVRDCHTKDTFNHPTKGFYITLYLFGAVLVLVITSTAYETVKVYEKDYNEKANKEKLGIRLFTSFSLIKNMKKLSKVDKVNDISIIHFVKVINILIIIYGHRFIYSVGFPLTYSDAVEAKYKVVTSIELVHANVVDVFFMVSGFLTYYLGYMPMKKAGEIYYPMSILLRWIRMVPVFCTLMLFIINVMPYMSNGPLWTERIINEANNCASSWWTNLLIVNNFVNVEKQCLVVSWYISTDMQLCILGGFLLYVISKHKKVGLFLTGAVFFVSAAITFTVAYVNHYDGILKLYISLLNEPRRNEQFNKFYIATFTRVGPYICGLIAGYATLTFLEKGKKFSTKQKSIISVLVILIGDGSQYYGYLMYLFGRPYNPFESAFYSAINRTLLAGTYATLIVLYMTSGLGFMNKFIRMRMFVPLGRLTYSVFLINTVIQLYHAASQRTPLSSSSRMALVWLVFGDIMITYIFGLLLHLIVEAPVTNISKMIQRKLTKVTIKKKAPEYLENGKMILPGALSAQLSTAAKSNKKVDFCKDNDVENGNISKNNNNSVEAEYGCNNNVENGYVSNGYFNTGFHEEKEKESKKDSFDSHL